MLSAAEEAVSTKPVPVPSRDLLPPCEASAASNIKVAPAEAANAGVKQSAADPSML